MRILVRAGSVRVEIDGADLSLREVKGLLRSVASVAKALDTGSDDDEAERPTVGFTAHVERASDDDWPGT